MANSSSPNFASSVATVDRVLAAQITSVFDNNILNDLKPEDIGAVAGVNPQFQLMVYLSSTTDLNLLGAVGTKVDLYTVPNGYRFLCDQFSCIFTEVTQNGSAMVGSTQPSLRAVKNNSNAAANHISNEISLTDAGQVVQQVNKYWRTGGAVGGTTSTTGKATAAAGEVISAYVTSAFVPGTNPYTVFKAKCFLTGWMIPV